MFQISLKVNNFPDIDSKKIDCIERKQLIKLTKLLDIHTKHTKQFVTFSTIHTIYIKQHTYIQKITDHVINSKRCLQEAYTFTQKQFFQNTNYHMKETNNMHKEEDEFKYFSEIR